MSSGSFDDRASWGLGLRERIRVLLEKSRLRALGLLEPLPEREWLRQHSPLMSPLIWDVTHIGHYEEQWLLRALGRPRFSPIAFDSIYDAVKTPRSNRPSLELMTPSAARCYLAEVRAAALEQLARVEFDSSNPLLKEGFVYGLVVQHEHQHCETMLATLQLMETFHYFPRGGTAPTRSTQPREVHVAGGEFVMGTSDDTWAYDNERPAHRVGVPPFFIDAYPVTNREYLRFIEAGGYEKPRFWDPKGWAFRSRENFSHPQFWSRRDGAWLRRRYDAVEPLPLDEPVQHVCWYEADAYARWAGKRLPTEAEWEKAASWHPSGRKFRYPWGDGGDPVELANLAQRGVGPSKIGSFPTGASPFGCEQMLGDVWEWTASDFSPYPNFIPFPYPEYSAIFFGDRYKVLRGGSWASDVCAVRNTFRNWDFPTRRQIFVGFRCARDA